MQRELTGHRTDLLKVVLPAAARGDLDAVRSFVKADKQWAITVGPHNRTMLWEAARKGRIDAVKFLLKKGADLNVAACYYSDNFVDISAYCIARANGHDSVADLLCDEGAEIDIYTHAYLGHAADVGKLIRKKPSLVNRDFRAAPRAKKKYEATPLHYGVAGSHFDVCDELIGKGAEVRIPGGMLLRLAVWRNNVDVVRLLLKNDANPSESGLTDWAFDETLAAMAAEYGFTFDIDMPNWIGFPALVDECRGNHNMPDDPQRVIAVLDKGANINITDHKGKTALHRAAQAGFQEITQVLIERGAKLDAQDDDGETPLFDAVKAGRAVTVRLLLEHGASRTAENRRGKTALDIATATRRPAIRAMASLFSSHGVPQQSGDEQ